MPLKLAKKPKAAPGLEAGRLHIAEVGEADQGEAHAVTLGTETLPVLAHGAATPAIEKGDRVLVLRLEGGAIVLDRLRRPNEAPYLHARENMLVLAAPGGLTLKSADVEVAASGHLQLWGNRIDLN